MELLVKTEETSGMLLVDYNNFYLLGMKLKDSHSFLQITISILYRTAYHFFSGKFLPG